MKKYLIILSLIVGFACTPDDDYNSADYDYVGIRTTGLPASVGEDSDVTVTIPVYYGGQLTNGSAITVNYTVSGGAYGTDYTIEGGTSENGSVSVAAGNTGSDAMGTIKIKPVKDFVTESNVRLTVTLVDASNGVGVGYPLKNSFSFTIADDDCDFTFEDFVGTAASKEKYADGSVYPSGTNTYDTEFTVVEGTTVEIDNFWDSGMVVQLTLNGDTRTVSVVENTWSQYGYTWSISGSGTLNTCGSKMSIEFTLTSPDYAGGYEDTFVIEYSF